MGRIIDLTGQKFGKLTVIERGPNVYYGKNAQEFPGWICQCECGAIKVVPGHQLRNGRVRSCGSKGCRGYTWHKPKEERQRLPLKWKRPYERELRERYRNMMYRCYCPQAKGYQNYGGRGIGVSEEWRGEEGFERFYLWATENGFDPKLSLDKIDNNRDYSPENCRWATFLEQQNNKRNNVRVRIGEEDHTVAEWSRMLGLSKNTLKFAARKRGCSVRDVLLGYDLVKNLQTGTRTD